MAGHSTLANLRAAGAPVCTVLHKLTPAGWSQRRKPFGHLPIAKPLFPSEVSEKVCTALCHYSSVLAHYPLITRPLLANGNSANGFILAAMSAAMQQTFEPAVEPNREPGG